MQTPSNDAERFFKIILEGQIDIPFCHYQQYFPFSYHFPILPRYALHCGLGLSMFFQFIIPLAALLLMKFCQEANGTCKSCGLGSWHIYRGKN